MSGLRQPEEGVKQLLYRRLSFTPADVRENIILGFHTHRAYDRLVIRLKYGPKAISDPKIVLPRIERCVEAYFPPGSRLTPEDRKAFDRLLNLVTLSVDKDGEYVGCAHRHAPEQSIVLSERGSSWGFAPVAASPGDWRLVLHVHAVVAGAVDYRVAAYGLERGERDDAVPAL